MCYSGPNAVDPKDLARASVSAGYIDFSSFFKAESRPELGVLPVNDDAYLAGYSLDRFRELVLVEL